MKERESTMQSSASLPPVTQQEPLRSASPQLENGYTRIANEIMEALADKETTGHLTSYDFRILIAVIRKTYGYRKKVDWISNSQLAKMTGIGKQHVSRTMKSLCDRRFLLRSGKMVGLNKNYHEWVKTLKGKKLPNEVTLCLSDRQEQLPPAVTKVTSLDDKSNLVVEPQKKKKENKGVSPKDGSTPSDFNLEKTESKNRPDTLRRKPRKPKKVTDPRVTEAIRYFSDTCHEMKGFKPAISGGKDGENVKKALSGMDLPELKDCIRFFLKHPKSDEHPSLSAAVSVDTTNLFRKNKVAGSQSAVPAYKRQHA